MKKRIIAIIIAVILILSISVVTASAVINSPVATYPTDTSNHIHSIDNSSTSPLTMDWTNHLKVLLLFIFMIVGIVAIVL